MNFIKNLFSRQKDSAIEPFLTRKDIKEAKKQGISLAKLLQNRYNLKEEDVLQLAEDMVLPYIKNGQNILEIGAGTGWLAEIIFAKFPSLIYYSFEPNKDLKKYLSYYFSDYAFHSMNSNGDGELIGIENKTIDVVIACGVFVYIRHKYTFRYFQEISKKLKSGGYFIFNIQNSDNPTDEFMQHMEAAHSWGRELLSANYVKKYLEKIGFEEVFLKKIILQK